MLTLRAAATLLARADSLAALRPIARLLGFPGEPLPISAHAAGELGLTGLVAEGELWSAAGGLRLVSATLAVPVTGAGSVSDYAGDDPRDVTRRLCTALLRNAPTRHWCALTFDPRRRIVYIATACASAAGPRVAALRVDTQRVIDSDADTLRALGAVTEIHDALRHARFSDILRRDALSARFYRALEVSVRTLADTADGHATAPERRELALLCASRCLFLAFLEAKGWLNDDHNFLLGHVTTRLEGGGRLHERLLRPLFFGTLNTPLRRRAATARAFGSVPFLNGGLFSPTALERRRHSLRFTDDALVSLVGDLLDRYRFTAREDSTSWSEAAVDPEMLGRAFECLMAAEDRRRSGSFYTPPALVSEVVREAVSHALPMLQAYIDDASQGTGVANAAPVQSTVLTTIEELRLLDPACGSGAFLVHALELLSGMRRAAGDARPLHLVRQDVLTRSIFGVDSNPMAVWLCELRLWLSVVIECPETKANRVPPLPNLDHHVRVGDTLQGGTFEFASPGGLRLARLRHRYTRATGPRKQQLGATLDREERARAIADATRQASTVAQDRRDTLQQLRAPDLFGQRMRRTAADSRHLATMRTRQRELTAHARRLALGGALPFRFSTHFADVAAREGFDLIVGNPPWVRPHAMAVHERTRLRAEYRTMRHASWARGAQRAGAGLGFAAQADLAAAFIERSAQLLAVDGTMALLVPAKLWRALAGGGVRRLLTEQLRVRAVHDWSDAPALFEAATYPSLIVAQRHAVVRNTPVRVRLVHADHTDSFDVVADRLGLDDDPSAPWVLLPPEVRDAFDAMRSAGPALGDSAIGRPVLGVKCGCNAAFLVQVTSECDEFATVIAGERTGSVERQMLRPVLRGEDLAYRASVRVRPKEDMVEDGHRIIWTHAADGSPLTSLPPRTARWLAQWRPRLEQRRDSRDRAPWWTLFRTDAARCGTPRVAWADIARRLATVLLPATDTAVPLNSCYVLRTASDLDALAMHALLSSPLASAWLDVIAEPARGGFRRYLGWTVATLPVPADWTRARISLAAVGVRMLNGDDVSPDELTEVVTAAYGISLASVLPLLRWRAA